jgi:hypothetical protein
MEEKTAGRTCVACRRWFPAEYKFCPLCGKILGECNNYESAFSEQLHAERESEAVVLRGWRLRCLRLYGFGAVMLVIPDMALLFIFSRWVVADGIKITRFLFSDVAVGMLAVFLVIICARRGIVGELMLSGLRLGQFAFLAVAGLLPFPAYRGLLNMLLFGLVPVLTFGFLGLVLRIHLTDILDSLSRAAPEMPREEV